MKYFICVMWCCGMFLSPFFALFARQRAEHHSFVPSHESAIRMLAVHDALLYALDENGLLTITESLSYRKKESSDSYMVIHRKHSIREAKFLYPYIVFVNNADVVHVYDIVHRYMVFAAPYKRDTAYVFSPSKSLFFYVEEAILVVVDTLTWEERQRHAIDVHPSYIAVSNTDKNVMLYDARGIIIYKNTYSGEVLKRIATLDALKHLSMNNTKRFAVGIPGKSLAVVDLVSGHTVDSIVISSVPKRIFPMHKPNKILSLGKFSDNAQIVQVFDFSSTGTLIEKDAVNIENTEDVSTIFAQERRIYLGFEDGSVSMYDLQDKRLKPVLFDETIANYDAQILNDTLFFANADGIRSISLSSFMNNSSDKELIPHFMPQVLVSPMFAIVSERQSLPYIVSRATITPLLFTLKKVKESVFHLLPPVRLSLVPSVVMEQGSQLLAYSQRSAKAQFIHYAHEQGDTTAKVVSPVSNVSDNGEMSNSIIDILIPHTSIAFDFGAESKLFTNAPLYENDEELRTPNVLYAYRILKNEGVVPPEYVKDAKKFFTQDYALRLPFSMDTVLFMRKLPSETLQRFILVKKVRSRLHNDPRMEILLVDYPTNENNAQARIVTLTREDYDEEALFLCRMSGDDVQLITLARDAMFLTIGNTLAFHPVSHIKIPYPQKISRIIKAHVTGSLLSAVDVNNLAFIAKLDGSFIDIQWLMMLNQTSTGRVRLLKENID